MPLFCGRKPVAVFVFSMVCKERVDRAFGAVAQGGAVGFKHDGSVLIGAQNFCMDAAQPLQRLFVRVPVFILIGTADDGIFGADSFQKCIVRGG